VQTKFVTAWAKKAWEKVWKKQRALTGNPITAKDFSDLRDFLVDLVAEDEAILEMVKHPGFKKLEDRVMPRYEDLIQRILFEQNPLLRDNYINEARIWNVVFSTLEEVPEEQKQAVLKFKELETAEPPYERSY